MKTIYNALVNQITYHPKAAFWTILALVTWEFIKIAWAIL
jgi:hypothetical protein